MSADTVRRLTPLSSALPQRPVAARPLMRQPESRVLQGGCVSAQLPLFQRPNGR